MKNSRRVLPIGVFFLNLFFLTQSFAGNECENSLPKDRINFASSNQKLAEQVIINKCGSCHFGNAEFDLSKTPFMYSSLSDNFQAIAKDVVRRNSLPLKDTRWNVPNKERMPPINAPDLTQEELEILQKAAENR